jgi:hydrogenase maturation protease
MILVAGIGNIFLGDDAFGSETARRLAARGTDGGVRIVDFGIRGLDLAYALMDGYSATIIIDAVQRGGEPGTLYVIKPDLADDEVMSIDAHVMDPLRVLAFARSLGASLQNVRIVGCEAETFGPPDEGLMGMSSRVDAAVPRAMELVDSLVKGACCRGRL